MLLDPINHDWKIFNMNGYPDHQKLRQDIKEIAKKNNDFDQIISETLKIFNQKYATKL